MKGTFLLSAFALLAAGVAWAGPVNINKADAKTLAKELDGVGPAKAEAIVKYRTEKGPFKSADDMLKVDGIGPAILEANKGSIKVAD